MEHQIKKTHGKRGEAEEKRNQWRHQNQNGDKQGRKIEENLGKNKLWIRTSLCEWV